MNAGVERFVGWALRSVRAGDRRLAWNDPRVATAPISIRLVSSAFADGGVMPERCAGEGIGPNLSPALEWSNLPAGIVDLVLIVQDPDAPTPRPIVHLIAMIPAGIPNIAEGASTPASSPALRFGVGSFGRIGYAGPRPVRGHGPHRYLFQLFAVGQTVMFERAPRFDALMNRIAGSVLARGLLTGTFERR